MLTLKRSPWEKVPVVFLFVFFVLFLENDFKKSVRPGGHEQMGKQCAMAQQVRELG